MATPIEDYALISDCRTAALISLTGDMDWLCLPRFDSPSVFGAILGQAEHGRWSLHPTDPTATVSRRYDGDTFVLITRWETTTGVAEVHDFIAIDDRHLDVVGRVDVVRRIVGISGEVEFAQRLHLRFDYARNLPWVRQVGSDTTPMILAIAGPDAVVVRGAPLTGAKDHHHGKIQIRAAETTDLTMTWFPSHYDPPTGLFVDAALNTTRDWWQRWADRIPPVKEYGPEVIRSLLVLRALTHRDTGGIVAAATTSLPEEFGGTRNWDYRYVWLRDAALTLEALIHHGFLAVAHHWREWLLRAVAGSPEQLQIMYGIAGERDLTEHELTSLPGYGGAKPVRIGNGASDQYQADVIGEVLVALAAARRAGLEETPFSWSLQRALVERVIAERDRPDHGIWEIRGTPQKFTHSRVMMWAALDRGIHGARQQGLGGPVARWEAVRDELRDEINEHGVTEAGYFSQYYGTDEVDASLLLLPQVGFCSPVDPRMLATVAQIEKTLMVDGLLHRYRTATGVDGISGGENPFLACSFWLVDQYAASGRLEEAHELMQRLCDLSNDVGLLSEEYDVKAGRHAGNTPQAFSHLTLVHAADTLARAATITR